MTKGALVDHLATVTEVEQHPLPYFTLTLRTPGDLSATVAGQFVMIQVEDRLEPYLRRAFSVFDVSKEVDGTRFQVLAKVVGPGTSVLGHQMPGNHLPVLGPLGRPFSIVEEGPVALVAGGVGSAGLYLLARTLAAKGVAFDVYYGGRSASDLVHREGFASFAAEVGGRLVATTEDGSSGTRGFVTEPLEASLADDSYRFVYACGPMPLLARLAELSASYEVPGEVALETPMGCGYGACLGCAVPHRSGRWALCCQDGPVFAFDEVVW